MINSSNCTTPRPSQSPIEPPKSARNDGKLKCANPILVTITSLLKLMTTEETFSYHAAEEISVPLVFVDLKNKYFGLNFLKKRKVSVLLRLHT